MIIQGAAANAVFSAEKMGKVTLCGGDFLFAGLNCFEPGQQHAPHVHRDQDKIYFILEGTGIATVADDQAKVSSGSRLRAGRRIAFEEQSRSGASRRHGRTRAVP
jgi:mannose-6-phosphate isomerase-like protein (cupin superfamily)